MYSSSAKNILCGDKGIHGESLFMSACVAFPINKTCEEISKNISQTHIVLSTQKPSACCKSSAWMALEKGLAIYFEITLLILQDYDTASTMQPAAQPWIWKSVSQGAYIHGSASSAAMLHASNEGWSFLRILLSSYRKRQTNLVWTCRARSVMLQIAALTCTIHRSNRRGWIRADCYIALFFFSLVPTGTVWLCVWPVFFFLLLLLNTFKLSLSQQHIQSCLSVSEKITANYGSKPHWHCYCKVTRRRTAYKQPSVPTALPDVLVNVLNSRRVLLLLSPALICRVTVQNVLSPPLLSNSYFVS